MNREAYESGRCRQAMQDGSRESISLLAYVNALGAKGTTCLLYQGASQDLQSSWVEDLDEEYPAFFGCTEKGWTNDAMGLEWLRKVFEPETKERAVFRRRLLILDGHSSHVNLAFLELCDKFQIIVLILPPHATHRLQPLDRSCFEPLSRAYGTGLDAFTTNSLGMVSMTKRSFWRVFKPAWESSFSVATITSGFTKTGIFPYNPEIVLGELRTQQQKKELEKATIEVSPWEIVPPTPMKSIELRRLQKKLVRDPSTENINLIVKASFKLAAQHSVDDHVKKLLIDALAGETKRRTRGKKLNLVGEESGKAVLFSSKEIGIARQRLQDKEDAEAAPKLVKAEEAQVKQASKFAIRVKTELRKAERRFNAEANKARKVAEKEANQLRRIRRKEDKENNIALQKQVKNDLKSTRQKGLTTAQMPVVISMPVSLGGVVPNVSVEKTSRNGRVIKMTEKAKE